MTKWTKDQQKAIDENGTNIIVSAGAGSGKTAVLTERVINKLKKGIHINELLILTFTKAAAEEMKDRIRSSLNEEPSLKEELEYLDSSYITTFDSFALSVVKKYHYKLNVSKNIGITDNTIILMKKKEIIDTIFEKYYSSSDEPFKKLIYDFCVKDDKDIKSSIIKIADKIELLPNKYEYLDNYLKNKYDDEYLNELLKEYLNILLNKKEEIFEELNNLSYVVPNDYFNSVSQALDILKDANDILTLTNINITLPKLPNGSDEEVKQAKEKLNDKISELTKYNIYGNEEEIKEDIILMKENSFIIIKIIKEYFTLLDEYKKNNDIYDFQDIALLAIEVVKNNDDVQKELKSSFKEIMIDEYQDTNDIQEMFISLISNNNVYMVGDIKQSIYRFRNANPNIFKNKYDNYLLHNGGIKIDLLKNFRSREEVVNNINTIFNYIMDDEIGGANYINSHNMVFGNDSYSEEGNTEQNYNMEILEYPLDTNFKQEEIEIFAIGKDILNKIKNKYQIFDKKEKKLHDATYSDFVILLDRSKSFDLYKKIFEYLKIPLTVYKDEKINEGYDLDIIKSLIDILIHIHEQNYDSKFKYDFISIARSYLYNLNDDLIFSYFLNDNFKESAIYKDLIDISKNLNNKTTYQILNEVINKTNLYEKLTSTNNIDSSFIKITKLLELAIELGNIGYDIYTFNEYLETLIEEEYEITYSLDNGNNNAVKIMTIHKSKGLEFNICYFAGLDKDFNIRDIKEKFTYSNKYGIITPIFKDGIRETIVKELLKENYYLEEIAEKIRLFYVAVTRAKEKMIFIIPEKSYQNVYKNNNGIIINSTRKKYRSFMDIIISIKKELTKYFIKLDINNLDINEEYLYHKDNEFITNNNEKLNVTEINILNNDIIESSYSKKLHEVITKETKNNLSLGLDVHESLELLDFINPNYDLIENEFIKSKTKKFLNSPLLSKIKNAKIYKEYEFIYQSNNSINHGVIDLMLEYDNHIDIIDYKLSNILDDNYLKQLEGYKKYIETLSSKKVNIYLYSIIKEEIKEILT